MTMESRSLPHAHLMDEIKNKELGYISHFLDCTFKSLHKTGPVALCLAGGLNHWATSGGFMQWLLPASFLATLVKPAVDAIGEFQDAKTNAVHYDGPVIQNYLSKVEDHARGVVASQRGSVWLVLEKDAKDLKVMGDDEYKAYRKGVLKSGQDLDEVFIRNNSVEHVRTLKGIPIPVSTGIYFTKTKVGRFNRDGDGKVTKVDGPPLKANSEPLAYSATRFLTTGTGHLQPQPVRVRADTGGGMGMRF